MIEQKIERLIEEAFSAENPARYIYHYSSIKFPEVRSLAMQGRQPKYPDKITDIEEYRKSFSATLAPLSADWVRRFRNNGFKAWGEGPLYEYKIDILKNRDAFVPPIKITSIPEEKREFRNGIWANFVKSNGINFRKMESDDKYWEEIKDKYMQLVRDHYREMLDKFVKSKYGFLMPENYVKSPGIQNLIKNWENYLMRNLRYGNKDQYATYLPHIHTEIRKPLIPDKITKII
jgi:hypothetical protein